MQSKTEQNTLLTIVVSGHLCAGTLLIALTGCGTNPTSVDDRVRRLLDSSTAQVHAEHSARLASRDAATLRTKTQNDQRPATANPAAAELRYTPATDQRDVSARLRTFASNVGILPAADGTIIQTQIITLQDSFRLSQESGRELLSAQEEYILTAISLLIERHLWGPRFFNDTRVSIAGAGDDGRFNHALSIVNTLRATQRLPYGGNLEAAWVWDATEQLREQATRGYTQSSRIVLSGNLPLLRGAGLVAREDLVQAERNVIYSARTFERFRRSYLVDIAADYFDLLQTKASIGNQRKQLESLLENERGTSAKVDAGRLEAFERDISKSQRLTAEASLSGLLERYLLQLDRFKIRLGIPVETAIDVQDDDLGLFEPDITLEDASVIALNLRLDLQNQRDQIDDQRRRVSNAQNTLLPDLNLDARATLPTDDDDQTGGMDFRADDSSYSAGITLSLPLDREQERLRLRQALIRLQRAERDYSQARDQIAVNVRSALRNIELARFQLRLAEEAVKINIQRERGQKLREATVTTQQKLDTQVSLLNAQNDRDRARTNLRNAVLNFLLESDQLRVGRNGDIEPIPGLTATSPDPGSASPDPVPAGADPAVPPAPEAPAGQDSAPAR